MQEHILSNLSLPDRYERLVEKLGAEVARILLPPDGKDLMAVRSLAADVKTRSEGVLVPLFGRTGAGKTTLVENIGQWLPSEFSATINYDGQLSYEDLRAAVVDFSKSLPHNNNKIIPINIDHRENNPPSDSELSAIKRFLRTSNNQVMMFWPETTKEVAESLSDRYVGIAGNAAIKLPLSWLGPERSTWADIASHTLSLANGVSNLDGLGVNPHDYESSKFETIGAYLRKISQDFNNQVLKMKSELEKPVSVVIAFVSESQNPGILSQLTSPSHYGLLDAHALVSVTSSSVIGKWWSARRGLLTRVIVQLDVRAICLPPTAAASCIRNFTDDMSLFDDIGYRRYGPARGIRDLGRSDLGKLITGEKISRFESRGTPPEDATAAFGLLSEKGFNLGKDKKLNGVMAAAIAALLVDRNKDFNTVNFEKKLAFCPLIPDNSIDKNDAVICIEYTWRSGEFLISSQRSTVSQYILTKLRNYARELGWTND